MHILIDQLSIIETIEQEKISSDYVVYTIVWCEGDYLLSTSSQSVLYDVAHTIS